MSAQVFSLRAVKEFWPKLKSIECFRLMWGISLLGLQTYIIVLCVYRLAPKVMPEHFWSIVYIIFPVVGVNLSQFLKHLFDHSHTPDKGNSVGIMHYIVAAWGLGAVAFLMTWLIDTHIAGSTIPIGQLKGAIAALECATGGVLPLISEFAFSRAKKNRSRGRVP